MLVIGLEVCRAVFFFSVSSPAEKSNFDRGHSQRFYKFLTDNLSKQTIESKLSMIRTKSWPNLEMIFIGALSLPLDNAVSERGFRKMNDIKTEKRSRMLDPLFPLVLLSIYGNDLDL